MRRMRSFSVSPSTYSKTMYGPAVLLARVDHPDDVRMAELGDRAGLAAEALELVGVRGDLAVHQLDRDLALQRHVERPIDRRHPARPDLGVEPVPPVQAHPDQRAHALARIVADVGGLAVTYVTDPWCPWSWAAEPAWRSLLWDFGADARITYVMAGMGGTVSDPCAAAREWLEAGARAGSRPIRAGCSTSRPPPPIPPALAVKAVAEQADPGRSCAGCARRSSSSAGGWTAATRCSTWRGRRWTGSRSRR
jgi:hypothetical protein